MKKARLITTLDCERQCSYCCNNYASIKALMQPLSDLNKLIGYDEIIITGGEPMLYPRQVQDLISTFRRITPNSKIYLYTAMYCHAIKEIIREVDGVHYTLHATTNSDDIYRFHRFQQEALYLLTENATSGPLRMAPGETLRETLQDILATVPHPPKKSFRLYVHPEVNNFVNILPWVWTRIESKPWIGEESCKLPQDEELFVL